MGRARSKTRTWTAAEIMALLRTRYAAPRWALMAEVADGTGMAARRSLDAVAFALWPSLGLTREGFEVKVSRGDWQREIQDPDKAGAFTPYLHRFWIVAAPGIVQLPELPATWGLMEPGGKGLRVRRPATKRDPQPPSEEFLAACMRRAWEQAPTKAALDAARGAGYEAGEERGIERGRSQARVDQREATDLRESVEAFEAASGIKIGRYNGRRLGDAVAALEEASIPVLLGRLRGAEGSVKRALAEFASAIEALQGASRDESGVAP